MLFSDKKPKFGLYSFDRVHEQLNFLEIVSVGFAMEIKPNVFYIFPWLLVEQNLKSIRQFGFILHCLFYQVNHDHTIVVLSNVVEVAFKHMAGQFHAAFDVYFVDETLLLLLPEQRDAASDLDKTIYQVVGLDYQFALHKIGYI